MKCVLALTMIFSLNQTCVSAQSNNLENKLTLSVASQQQKEALKISLSKSEMALPEILKELNQKYNLNFIFDVYTSEIFPRGIKIESLTIPQAMQLIASVYNRKIIFINGIYILRSPNWAKQAQYQEEIATGKRPAQAIDQWPDAGSVTVERHDAPENLDLPLPAKDISVRAERVSATRFMSELMAKSLWRVRTDPSIKDRRFSVFVSHVAPGILIEDIGYLLNAGPEITLRPTPLNLALLEDEQSELPEDWRKRKRLSDKIKGDLEKLLTPADKERIAQGDFAAIPVNKMPKELQGRVLDYLNQCVTLMGGDTVPLPDGGRSQDFAIRFKPRSSGLAWEVLGAMVIGANGTEYYF